MKSSLKKTLIGLAIAAFMLNISLIGILHFSHSQYFTRYDLPAFTPGYTYSEIEPLYPRELVYFQSGANQLTGYIYGPLNSKGLVVFSHGLEGGADDYLHLIIYLIDQGWRVFAFDNTGSHRSQGKNVVSHAQSALDLDNALKYVGTNETLAGLPIMLLGHSWGGYAVGAVLNFPHQVAAAVSLSGYDTPIQQMDYQLQSRLGKAGRALYPQLWLYMQLRFGKLATLSAIQGINRSDANVLVIQGTHDPFYGNVSSIYANRDKIYNSNCSLYLLAEPNTNGHTNYFYTAEALDYHRHMSLMYPDIKSLANNIDKQKWNEVNLQLLDYINQFFEQALPSAE